MVIRFGRAGGLRFELTWSDNGTTSRSESAAEVTRGRVRTFLGEWPLWGRAVDAGFEWSWVELLEHLAIAWPSLLLEDGLPFGLAPESPSAILASVDERWDRLSKAARADEEEQFEAFQQSHDLAQGVAGAWLAPIWIVREGAFYWVTSEAGRRRRPADEVLETLEALGNEIDSRLRLCVDDARADLARQDWATREAVDPGNVVSIATGLTAAEVESIGLPGSIQDAWELDAGTLAGNELLAVARLASDLDASLIARIVQSVKAEPGAVSLELARDAAEASGLYMQSGRAHEQGATVARWLREVLGLKANQRCEPEALFDRWRTPVREVSLGTTAVDAFACWGDRHGPSVFLNKDGAHNVSLVGQRMSLAHEACHLLLDREGALPFAEVLGGRTGRWVEARANAFAAELLLPMDHARASVEAAADLAQAVESLHQYFGVSDEVAAWQVRNSGASLSKSDIDYLRSRVSRPEQF